MRIFKSIRQFLLRILAQTQILFSDDTTVYGGVPKNTRSPSTQNKARGPKLAHSVYFLVFIGRNSAIHQVLKYLTI